MRFAERVSCAALFTIAALTSGDRIATAGPQSGHAGGGGKKTLGASYANRRTTASKHVPGKSGIASGKPAVKTTVGSSLGASRVATTSGSKSTATVEPAAKSKARATRPVKTRAEERAIKARAQAKDAESTASMAEAEAESARRTAVEATALATQRADGMRSAQAALKGVRQELAQAKSSAESLEAEALADQTALDALRQAAKKKKGSKTVRAIISVVSFGWISAPKDLSGLADELASRAAGTRRSAGRASKRVAEAEFALVAAEQALISAETVARSARNDALNAVRRADALDRVAAQLRTGATSAAKTAAELEDAADVAALRFDHRIARVDQHRLRISKASKSEQGRFRRAAKLTQLATFIESKPAEISQDALAAAPEKGLYAIADGVTNSDYSGEFARSLVRRWTETAPEGEDGFADWLGDVQAEWDAEVKPLIAGKAGAWYNRNRTWQGDAAFVGARLVQSGARRQLKVTGIGDTVAFLVRGGRIVASFPLERAAEFSDVVKALPSVGKPLHAPLSATWEVAAGDEVFMGTDALANWVLGETEAGRDPWPVLRSIKSQKQMDRFVADARTGALPDHGAMGVDDTALLRFVVPAGPVED